MYVYESHMGGLYTENCEVDFDDLYCEQCGDYDWEIGCFDTMAEFLKYYANDIAVDNGDGGYDIEYILDVLPFDNKPAIEDAIKIVKENKT